MKEQRDRWSTREVCEGHRFAPAFFCAIVELASERKSRVLQLKRKVLADRTGCSRPGTISRCLTVLHNAGWLTRHAHFMGHGTSLKIILPKTTTLIEQPTVNPAREADPIDIDFQRECAEFRREAARKASPQLTEPKAPQLPPPSANGDRTQ